MGAHSYKLFFYIENNYFIYFSFFPKVVGKKDFGSDFSARVMIQQAMPPLVANWYSSVLSKKTDAALKATLKKKLPELKEQYTHLDEMYSAVPIDAVRVHFAAVSQDVLPLFGELETEAAKKRNEIIDRTTVVTGLARLVLAVRDLDDLAFDFGFATKPYK